MVIDRFNFSDVDGTKCLHERNHNEGKRGEKQRTVVGHTVFLVSDFV